MSASSDRNREINIYVQIIAFVFANPCKNHRVTERNEDSPIRAAEKYVFNFPLLRSYQAFPAHLFAQPSSLNITSKVFMKQNFATCAEFCTSILTSQTAHPVITHPAEMPLPNIRIHGPLCYRKIHSSHPKWLGNLQQ